MEKAHAPCDDLIASLRKQLAALEAQLADLQAQLAGESKDAEIEDLKKRLAASEKQQAELMDTYNRLKAEHDKCPDLIAALRRQIKETKDALELDDSKLEATKVQV